MPVGAVFPSESSHHIDSRTGVHVRQVTNFAAIHHHPFYYIPAYDDSGQRLFFVSHRQGRPQLFFEDGSGGSLVQITDRDDLNEWSCHPLTQWTIRVLHCREFCVARRSCRDERGANRGLGGRADSSAGNGRSVDGDDKPEP